MGRYSSSTDKILLPSIKSLTFHRNAKTAARRGEAIPQLTCKGKACNLYQPDVVQCSNMGDDGAGNVQWKCDTDLPSSLRMGEIEVSCEGWSKPGDKYVLKGSCGLEYSLNRINRDLEEGYVRFPPRSTNIGGYLIFFALCIPLFCILYSLVRALFRRHAPRYTPPPLSRFWPGGWGGGGGGGGGNLPGFGGGRGGGGGGGAPPPPYSKDPAEARSGPGWLGGAAMGTAAGYLLSQARNRNTNNDRREQEWDRFRTGAPLGWEQDPMFGRGGFGGGYGGGTRAESSRMAGLRNRGNESSDLGEMRSATGFGGSNVR